MAIKTLNNWTTSLGGLGNQNTKTRLFSAYDSGKKQKFQKNKEESRIF